MSEIVVLPGTVSAEPSYAMGQAITYLEDIPVLSEYELRTAAALLSKAIGMPVRMKEYRSGAIETTVSLPADDPRWKVSETDAPA